MGLSEKAKLHKAEYTKNYHKQNYKRIPLDVKKDYYDQLKEIATNKGETVNGFIKKAIDYRIANDT